jgi:pyochelin biosynthesis protein PchC
VTAVTSLVLVNRRGEHSLWPAATPVPPGWTIVHAAARDECLAYVRRTWSGPTRRRVAPCFRRRPVAEPRRRLVCFPHAGGAATAFHDWPGLLPSDVELLAVQYPGRQERFLEPAAERVEDLADEVVRGLLDLPPLPVTLFGHSMGALVAYEVARRTTTHPGLDTALLAVSAREAPDHRPDLAGMPSDSVLAGMVRELGGAAAAALAHPDTREVVLGPLRADHRTALTYRIDRTVPVDVPVIAFGGDTDQHCPAGLLSGWSRATGRDFRTHVLPGDHFYLDQHAAELIAALFPTTPERFL